MFANAAVLIVMAALAVAGGYGSWRSLRIRDAALRWIAAVSLGVAAAILALVTILVAVGIGRAYSPRGNPVVERTVESTPEKVQRGVRIALVMCSSCHALEAGSLPLTGGKDLFADIPIPIGKDTPPNLTPAGRIASWSDGELERAIREGTGPDGHLLPVMSTQTFRNFDQNDLDSIVAYLRSQPAVNTSIEEKRSLNVLAMAMFTLGMLPVKPLPDPQLPPSVPIGPTVEYGAYIAGYFDCVLCHGEGFTGGTSQLAPRGPALASVKGWTRDQFIAAMRTGVSPSMGPMNPDKMPWKNIALFDDVELTALYEFLKVVP